MANSIVPSIIKSYQGKNIRVNPADRYTCLTDMATASGKKLSHWHQLEGTKAYLDALSQATGIAAGVLLRVENGVATWAHPKVAIKFAAWCSAQFEVQMTTWIDELLTTGSVSIAPKSALELAKEQVALLERIERLEVERQILSDENEQLAEAVDELFDYSSIVRIAKYNGCSEKDFNWRALKVASQLVGAEIKQVPCPRFGTKNLYSHTAWRESYPAIDLPETTIIRVSQLVD